MRYEYVGTTPTTLAHGQPVAFGDVVDLTKGKASENAELIDAGALVPVVKPDAKSDEKSSATPDEKQTPDNGEEGDE